MASKRELERLLTAAVRRSGDEIRRQDAWQKGDQLFATYELVVPKDRLPLDRYGPDYLDVAESHRHDDEGHVVPVFVVQATIRENE